MLLWPDILKLSSIIKKNTMEQPAVKKALFCLINGQIETDGAERRRHCGCSKVYSAEFMRNKVALS